MAATLTAIHGSADVAGMLRRAREADALRVAAGREADRMLVLARRAGATDLQVATAVGHADGPFGDSAQAWQLQDQVTDLERQVAKLTAELQVATDRAGALYKRKVSTATKRALAAKRRRGETVGRPAVADRPDLAARIRQLRAPVADGGEGMTLQAIADQLNAEGVPTARGAAGWRPSSVAAAAGYKRPT